MAIRLTALGFVGVTQLTMEGQSTFWRDRPTFVTGATGLLGGWLVKRFCDLQATVVCLVRDGVPDSNFMQMGLDEKVTIVRGDIRDQSLLERILNEYEIDTVFHLAAQTIVDTARHHPANTLDSNIRGTWVVLDACRQCHSIRQIVFASSDKAYGECSQLPYCEDMPLRGAHPYDVSKACADMIAQMYVNDYDLPIVITRCGNLYGGGDLNFNRLIPGTIRSVFRGENPVIRSDGQLVRDYLYVEDAVRAYVLLAERLASKSLDKGSIFNIAGEVPASALDVVNTILRLMESQLKPDIRNFAHGEISHQQLDVTRAKSELGWQANFSMEEGLKRTIAWYRNFLSVRDV